MLKANVATSRIFLPVKDGQWSDDKNKLIGNDPARCSTQFRPVNVSREPIKLSITSAAGLGSQLPNNKRGPIASSKRKSSVTCYAALNARCASLSGQTATITQKSPTITQAPNHENSPKIDDGDSGFPPRDDGGGGGGGGGGGNFSGGFFLFGFLAFLGLLKDKESEEDFRDR